VATPREREYLSAATFVCHTVSADTKDLPYVSFRGHRYVIVFVDHYSRYRSVYFLTSKDQSTAVLKTFVADMARSGHRIIHLQTDRGSEFFEQEGESRFNAGRRLHEFNKLCEQHNILHIVQPVEMHEKLAETCFLDLFRDVNAMLWEARLSPAFWVDGCAYACLIFNNTPNGFLGGSLTPHGVVTGRRSRWDKFKVFGCDVYEVIPNNQFSKVPGIPRGRKMIFVGFDPQRAGFKLFDPVTRTYHSAGDCYFFEDFSERVDALLHHDQRRALLRKGAEQPVVVNDFDDPSATGVRSLFLDPDALPPAEPISSAATDASRGGAVAPSNAHLGGAPVSSSASLGGAASRSAFERATDDVFPSDEPGPLSRRSVAAERARQAAQQQVMLRPLRLLVVGKEAPYTAEDRAFLEFVKTTNIPLVFRTPNPKTKGSSAYRRYHKYMHSTSYIQAMELGATWDDFVWDYRRGFISFPKHEPQLSGHVFSALDLAAQHGHTHVLQDLGLMFRRSPSSDPEPAHVFNIRGKRSFNEMLATVYEPELVVQQLEDVLQRQILAEKAFSHVLLASPSSPIDYSIAPEPTRYQQVLPEVCAEHERWREAMDDEIASMVRFGVYRRVPRSAAGSRQILGCRWVYKRKVGEDGLVYRYRARLVAQGYSQRAHDSYDPDNISSPVVHKESLRLFLAVAAHLRLRVHQADVKTAFLQAPLSERIFMRCPPGYASTTSSGEEEILELHQAIYGLKQASASFWAALESHLSSKGFTSLLSDPCVFKKVLPDGRLILVCVYVDDLVYAVPDDSCAADFLTMIRERFVVEEGEGKPVRFLLGIAVHQDLAAGTISLDMSMAIDKLAKGILTPEEMVKSKGIHYPMLLSPLPRLSVREVPQSQFDFLSVLGSLLHIANCVRIDIATAVNILARHAAAPGVQHVQALKRVLMYLYNMKHLGIVYRSSTSSDLPLIFEKGKHPLDDGSSPFQIFSDSDYAVDYTRRSTMGIVIMLHGGPIAWTSTLGKTVATSTCEAEVNAAAAAAKDAVHLKTMLVELGQMPKDFPIRIAEDNSAAIAQAEAGLMHIRNAKHYAVRLRFLQQLVVDREVEFIYTPTDQQLADFLTKPLDVVKFQRFRDLLLSVVG